MSIKNGGPAYPQMRVWNAAHAEYEDTQQYPGMSLRDWFAGTLPAVDMQFSDLQTAARFLGCEPPDELDHHALIEFAARLEAKVRWMRADAMIAAREADQ